MSENFFLRLVLGLQLLRILAQYKLFFSFGRFIPPMGALSVPPEVSYYLSGAFTLLLIAIISFPQKKYLYCGLVLFPLILLLDGTKLSVVNYQTTLIFGWIAITRFSSEAQKFLKWGLAVLYLVPYFWSGLWKMNHLYFLGEFPDFFQIPAKLLGISKGSWVVYPLGVISILLELLLPILFVKKDPRFPALLVFLHLFILMALGPLGMNTFPYIWMWNIDCMIVLLYLFHERDPRPSRLIAAPFLLWALIPVMAAGDFLTDTFSFKMYSGSNNHFLIVFQGQGTVPDFPQYLEQRGKDIEFQYQLTFVSQLDLPFPNNEDNLRNLCRHMQNLYPGQEISLDLWKQKSFMDKRRTHYRMPCQKVVSTSFLLREMRKHPVNPVVFTDLP